MGSLSIKKRKLSELLRENNEQTIKNIEQLENKKERLAKEVYRLQEAQKVFINANATLKKLLLEANNKAQKNFCEALSRDNVITEKDTIIAARDTQIGELYNEIACLKGRLAGKDTIIIALTSDNTLKDTRIRRFDDEATDINEEVARLNGSIMGKDSIIDALTCDSNRKQTHIKCLKHELKHLKCEVNSFQKNKKSYEGNISKCEVKRAEAMDAKNKYRQKMYYYKGKSRRVEDAKNKYRQKMFFYMGKSRRAINQIHNMGYEFIDNK
jgi:chromosome segregation ATPase